MVKSLDAIPWKERQWGHWLARTIINTKQKIGMGGGIASPQNPPANKNKGKKERKTKNVKRR